MRIIITRLSVCDRRLYGCDGIYDTFLLLTTEIESQLLIKLGYNLDHKHQNNSCKKNLVTRTMKLGAVFFIFVPETTRTRFYIRGICRGYSVKIKTQNYFSF